MRRGSIRATLAVTLLTAVVLAGCSSSSKSGSSATTTTTTATSGTGTSASSPVCTSLDTLKSSITDLTSPATLAGGKTSIQAALDTVKKNLTALKSTVSSGDKPKVDAVTSSITDLQKAVDNLNGVSGLSDVATAGSTVAQSVQALVTALKAGCPSA